MNWTDFGFALKYESQINDWNQFYSSDYTGNSGANIPYLEVRYDSTYSNIKEGVYLLKNASSGKYISVSGAGIQLVDKSSNNPSIEWCIKENFYTDLSFDLLLNNDRSKKIYFDSNSGTAIMQTNASDGFSKWFFEEVGNGRYVISSTGRPWMCLEGSGNQLKVSSNNSSLSQQWILDTYGFGSMEFRELHPSEYGLLNCHAYALMLNDINREWDYTTRQYILSLNNALPTSNIKNTVASLWKNDFEVWLSNNNYVYEYENNFSSNGESRYLGPNQYRIVMRTGYQVYTPASGTPVVLYDYHFWYQTYSGQWANKHGNGLTSYSASQLLPSGITPFSNNTSGWNYYITNGTSLEYEYVNFYDSQIYSYIITVQ
ncbi:MAG: hypothetical protein IJD37_04600 [Clostridia bacterium]|nr:hypothetical protein [Clostridia bacterium]